MKTPPYRRRGRNLQGLARTQKSEHKAPDDPADTENRSEGSGLLPCPVTWLAPR